MSSEQKLMMTRTRSFTSGTRSCFRRNNVTTGFPPPHIFPNQRSRRANKIKKMPGIKREVKRDIENFSNFSHTTFADPFKVLNSLVISFAVLMSLTRIAESVPQGTPEKLDSKIKTFLESHCTMQNQTLEQDEFQSFMSCGPSHGAGIVKNLGRIPEYKSEDTELWARATKREIISQCDVWPHDKDCQETTFKLIEKCFEKDQKFIFYFMFALTDVICQSESNLFITFWQNGGDSCLGNHIRSLKKDFSDCFVKTSTVSSADVYRNFDDIMHCFRSQFDNDCIGEGANEVLQEIMEEIKRVYQKTSSGGPSTVLPSTLSIFLFLSTWLGMLVL